MFYLNSTFFSGKDTNTNESAKPFDRLSAAVKRTDTPKSEPVSSVLHLVEALALVMLCNYRVSSRRVSVLILKEVKCLLKLLNCSEEPPVIDVIDPCCAQAVEKCLSLLPAVEKTALQGISNVDLQWLADRNSCIWTAGLHEDGSLKPGSGFSLNNADPWSICLFSFLEKDRILSLCPAVVSHSWPIVFTRLNTLFPVVDPT